MFGHAGSMATPMPCPHPARTLERDERCAWSVETCTTCGDVRAATDEALDAAGLIPGQVVA